MLIHEDEARATVELEEMYVVQPSEAWWFGHGWQEKGQPLSEGFRYSSDSNKKWLTLDEISEIVASVEAEFIERPIV